MQNSVPYVLKRKNVEFSRIPFDQRNSSAISTIVQKGINHHTINYRKSSIRSRPCIILDPKIPRFVLGVLCKVKLIEQMIFMGVTEGPMRSPKMSKKFNFDDT